MKKGFTLIELMIIVAIIGILAAIAVPKFVEVKTRYRVTQKYEALIKASPYKKEQLIKERDEEISKAVKKALGVDKPVVVVDKTYGVYQLQNGTIAECSDYAYANGLTNLSDCKDGREYLSQTNIVKIK